MYAINMILHLFIFTLLNFHRCVSGIDIIVRDIQDTVNEVICPDENPTYTVKFGNYTYMWMMTERCLHTSDIPPNITRTYIVYNSRKIRIRNTTSKELMVYRYEPLIPRWERVEKFPVNNY